MTDDGAWDGAERLGDLLDDDQQPDAGEHPLDDRRREVVGEATESQHAEHDLDDPGEHDGDQEHLVRAETRDRVQDDDRQPRRRAADAEG